MRKIISKENKNKNKRKIQFIVGGCLIFVMLFSVVGYSFQTKESEEDKKITYNGFEFINNNGFWTINMGSFSFIFENSPEEVPEITSELKYLNNYQGKPLYVYSEDYDSEVEIYRNLDPRGNKIVQRIQPACLDEENCEENVPLKTCEDNFIIIETNNQTEISQEENCVFIQGPLSNLTQITDGFLFKILGIQ